MSIEEIQVSKDVSHEAATLNELSKEIGEWARSKGFREDWELTSWLNNFSHAYAEDIIDDDQDKLEFVGEALRTNIIAGKLMLMVSELSEALETLRNTGADNLSDGNLGEELADCIIRILDCAHMLDINIGNEIMRKVERNRDRPYKHGRKM
jgi:NTP pyrophosphatase (non-canonical NTP hydrolase)